MVNSLTNMLYLYVGFFKTNQFGAVPISVNPDPALDPVRHVNELFTRIPAGSDSPAFTFSKNKHISYEKFTKRLKTLLGKAGYPPNSYSGQFPNYVFDVFTNH